MSNIKEKNQSNLDASLFSVTLDRNTAKPLHAQLANALRAMILDGGCVSGSLLPASRTFAEELSVSRMTVTTAYDQLIAEGYLVTRKGAGTFVAGQIPHLAPPVPRQTQPARQPDAWLPFQTGLPDQSLFPHRVWARHLERVWRAPTANLLAKSDPFGWYPLRAAICDHLSAWRGLDCDPDQVVITGGAWDAFEIICRALLKSGQRAAVEDPGWPPLRHLLNRSEITAVPVRIDETGLNVEQIPDDISAVIVTPSRHYPTGLSMPLVQRLALLQWAKNNQALIVEDDYDSEFRYQGQPLPSLSGLDGLQNTMYLGSFSKLLSPALRIGYLVLPTGYLEPARTYLSATGSRASLIPQPSLAEFMSSGEFAIHLRRLRRTYAKRQAGLISALDGLTDSLDIRPDPSGMHLCCPLQPELSQQATDREIAALGTQNQLVLRALSSHSALADPPQGLLLGYAAFDIQTLRQAAQKLTQLVVERVQMNPS